MATMFMETTQISDTKTVAEIQQLLAENGAISVMVEYKEGYVDGLAFRLQVGEQHVPFRLPCRWQAVENKLRRRGRSPRRNDTYQGLARRIAWRQILRWVEAQLALIETGMVKSEEVFLPYALMQNQTVYELFEKQKFLALPAPQEEPEHQTIGAVDARR